MTNPFRTDWRELSRSIKGHDLITYAARSLCHARFGHDEFPKLASGQQAEWHRRAARTLRDHGIKIDVCKACGEIDPIIPQATASPAGRRPETVAKAAPANFPYTDHRTVAQVDAEGSDGD
jgi:hypothetical protein